MILVTAVFVFVHHTFVTTAHPVQGWPSVQLRRSQIVLLGRNRQLDTCVWTSCPESLRNRAATGMRTRDGQVASVTAGRRTTSCTTDPPWRGSDSGTLNTTSQTEWCDVFNDVNKTVPSETETFPGKTIHSYRPDNTIDTNINMNIFNPGAQEHVESK